MLIDEPSDRREFMVKTSLLAIGAGISARLGAVEPTASVTLFTSIGRQAAIGSCASLSCLVLPAGMTAAGLPVGLEFDALPGADRRLLALGLSLENALGSIRPPTLHA